MSEAAEVLALQDVDVVRAGKTLLEGINLSVRSGEHWALLGPNGAGKSTLLTLCGAVAHPTRGSVRVLGHQLGRVDISDLRRSIGHVNPRHRLRSALSVTDVVLTGATGSIELVPRWQPSTDVLLRAAELTELLGLTAIRDEPWTTLSQGERGRTLIARALLPRPLLLLLDEPSTGLDVAAREQLLQTLDALHHGEPKLASIVVTHHLEELPASTTHAALLASGKILTTGPATDVLTSGRISECFSFPIDIDRRDSRWRAHARPQPPELR